MISEAGLVILPAYYAASLNQDKEQVIQYYVDVCEKSPVRLLPCTGTPWQSTYQQQIPLFLYNFPANSGGQDMSSEIIEAVMQRAPNLCGVKLTYVGPEWNVAFKIHAAKPM